MNANYTIGSNIPGTFFFFFFLRNNIPSTLELSFKMLYEADKFGWFYG